MKVNLPLPSLGGQSVKEHIISVLSSDYPLSLKRIHPILKTRFALGVTNQAVHKALNQMVEEGILEKKNRDYLISKSWIKELKSFTKRLELNYIKKRKLPDKDFPTVVSFKHLREMYEFFLNALINRTFCKDKKRIVCFLGLSMWNPMVATKEQVPKVFKLTKLNTVYVVAKSHTFFDNILKRFWHTIGMKVAIGKDCVTNHDCVVIGDYVFEVYYGENLREHMDDLHKKTRSLLDLDIKELWDKYFYMDSNIKVLINKDKEIADRMRRYTLGFFKENELPNYNKKIANKPKPL